MPTLEEWTPLISKIAHERTAGPSNFDDDRQEALIKVWQALEKDPDASASRVAIAAKRGIFRFYSRGVFTGTPPQPYAGSRAARVAERKAISVDRITDAVENEGARAPASMKVPDFADSVCDRLDVARALALLDEQDRRLVIEHFWRGRPFREIARDEGVTPQAISHRWKVLAPKLRELLAA